jgi:hypothetical protein
MLLPPPVSLLTAAQARTSAAFFTDASRFRRRHITVCDAVRSSVLRAKSAHEKNDETD